MHLDRAAEVAKHALVATLFDLNRVQCRSCLLGGVGGSTLFAPLAMSVVFCHGCQATSSADVVPTMVLYLLAPRGQVRGHGHDSAERQKPGTGIRSVGHFSANGRLLRRPASAGHRSFTRARSMGMEHSCIVIVFSLRDCIATPGTVVGPEYSRTVRCGAATGSHVKSSRGGRG